MGGVDPSGYTQASSVRPSKGATTKRAPVETVPFTALRLSIRRGYGFHSATAALALVMLACGPINLVLPHEQPALQTAA